MAKWLSFIFYISLKGFVLFIKAIIMIDRSGPPSKSWKYYILFAYTQVKIKQNSYQGIQVKPIISDDPLWNLNSQHCYYGLSYLTIIIPRAQMGSESIAHEAEGWMGY